MVSPGVTRTFIFQRKVNSATSSIVITNKATGSYEDPNNPNIPINNTSNTVNVNLTGDTIAPDTTIAANPPSLTNSSSATFNFTGTDNVGVTSFEARLDGGAFITVTSPITYTGLTDGSHTFEVRAKDAAGNVDGTPATYTWTVDTTAPSSPVIFQGVTNDNGFSTTDRITNDNTPTFTGTAEPSTTVTLFQGGSNLMGTTTVDASGNWTFTSSTLASGSYSITAKATDAANNVSVESVVLSITIDTIVPTLLSIEDDDADNMIIVGNPVTYTFTFSEDIDSTTVTTADFNNAGTATIAIGSITEINPGVFTVVVTPSTSGTIILQIPMEAVISDVAGNNLTIPVQDNDTIITDVTTNNIRGTTRNENLLGLSDRKNIINADGGNDTLIGAIYGDSLMGGSGNDNIIGFDGDNYLDGGSGNDSLIGGNDKDILSGGSDNDTLIGGNGNDNLRGGGGRDYFVFQTPNEGIDRITDFNVADDFIQISGIVSLTQIIYNRSTGDLFYDPDGDGGIDEVHVAILNNRPGLTGANIIIA